MCVCDLKVGLGVLNKIFIRVEHTQVQWIMLVCTFLCIHLTPWCPHYTVPHTLLLHKLCCSTYVMLFHKHYTVPHALFCSTYTTALQTLLFNTLCCSTCYALTLTPYCSTITAVPQTLHCSTHTMLFHIHYAVAHMHALTHAGTYTHTHASTHAHTHCCSTDTILFHIYYTVPKVICDKTIFCCCFFSDCCIM